MESSKHSLQDHHLLLLSSSSSSSSSPTSSCTTLLHDSSSCYAATTPIPGGSPHLCWTPNIFLNSAGGNSLSSSYVNNQSLQNHQVHLVSSSMDSTMNPHHHHQDLSFHHWANDTNINTNIINPHQDLQQFSHSHNNIKRELSYSKKFSELISSSPSSSSTIEDHHHHQSSNSSHHRATTNFLSQIYPTINISSSSSSSSSTSTTTTFDMNLQALDLFHYSARSLMQDQLDLSSSRRNGGGALSYNALHHDDHHYIQRPFASTNMTVLPFSSTGGGVVAETKRSDDEVLLLETKATYEAEVAPAPANKRSRLESRASCTPFKVRKEKLGDRIAALQQLVAPFGKTDTASVLMEAIGYIKFLQNQVETLSVPYLKSSRNKTHQRPLQGDTILNEERKRDLKSRGLCLVPLSCLSYMTDSGGAVWPPPNFGGGT